MSRRPPRGQTCSRNNRGRLRDWQCLKDRSRAGCEFLDFSSGDPHLSKEVLESQGARLWAVAQSNRVKARCIANDMQKNISRAWDNCEGLKPGLHADKDSIIGGVALGFFAEKI